MKKYRWLFLLLFLAAPVSAQSSRGPSKGTLIVVGGGRLGPVIIQRFVDLAGGASAPVVVIPTANDGDPTPATLENFKKQFGLTNVTMLHSRDKKQADTKEFVGPLKKARGVFFTGGRQWRLADAYLGTRTEKELRKVLKRGGVVAGSSAGATIQGSYLVRGAVEGNTVMMSPGHERGFAYLQNVAVDQHIITRHRESDMSQVIKAHPGMLGIGIDESTAIVVHGDRFEIIGASKVAITDGQDHEGKPYYFLKAGDRFNLRKWAKE